VLEWTDPPYSAGHWIPDLVAAGGGCIPDGRPGEVSTRVPWSAVSGSGVDVVIVAPCGYHLDAASELARAVAPRLPVGTEVWAVDADSYFVRPGPRLERGAEIVAAILHPSSRGSAGLESDARRIR
jgi:iron complex transport system substrate-binding protein